MKILIITLEYRKDCLAANQTQPDAPDGGQSSSVMSSGVMTSGVMGSGNNELAIARQQRLLPIQLLSIAADLMDAGHQVHWPEESLRPENMQRIVADAQQFKPDVLFFACGDNRTSDLMASVAVKTGGIPGNQFLNEKTMRPARYWRDKLTDQRVTVDLLKQLLTTASACELLHNQD